MEVIEDLKHHPLLKDFRYEEFVKRKQQFIHQEIVQSKLTRIYKGIFFCFHEAKLEIIFKPHYYFNDNFHNANDFTTNDCINILNEFIEVFSLVPSDLKILGIEFGLNCLSPIKIEDLVTMASYHGKNQFNTSNDNLKFSKVSAKSDLKGRLNKYKKIKFYGKGIQFPKYTDPNTFRFEINSNRTQYIRSLGVYTLNDLLTPDIYNILAEHIIQEFKEILFLDFMNKGINLTTGEKNRFVDYQSSFSWYIALQQSRNTFNNNKKAYFKLLDKTGDNIHIRLLNIVKQKLNKITSCCAVLTPPPEKVNLVQF